VVRSCEKGGEVKNIASRKKSTPGVESGKKDENESRKIGVQGEENKNSLLGATGQMLWRAGQVLGERTDKGARAENDGEEHRISNTR